MPPHQRAERGHRHHAPAQHAEPGRRHVQEHDLDGGALLIIVRRQHRLIDAEGEREHRQAAEPRNRAVGEVQETRRIGEIGEGHGRFLSSQLPSSPCGAGAMPRALQRFSRLHDHNGYSISCRSAAAAANGPTTRLASVSAHRIVNGVPNGTGPARPHWRRRRRRSAPAPSAAARARRAAARRAASVTAMAAPIRPMKVSAGVPTRSVSTKAAFGRRVEIEQKPDQRRGDDERQAGGEPMGKALRRDHELKRRAAHEDQIERAVLVVGGEQAVERQQARQQRREPQDRRADALEQRAGPDRPRTASA